MASPIIVKTPAAARAACDAARAGGKRVGFVPTMGALHEGHLSLVERARKSADFVAVSIFVNPTQFGPNEDFTRYPRDLEGDTTKLGDIALLFAPDPPTMYPEGESTRVTVSSLAQYLDGPHRPGHFEGVATVVTKLFSAIGPCTAVFGEKDWQQLAVIRRMVKDLFLPIDVVGAPIVREADGLAMSSRNAYLSADERTRALSISRGLRAARAAWDAGERHVGRLVEKVVLEADSVDYVTISDPDSLVPLEGSVARGLIAVACRIGNTRLIDNLLLD